MMNKMVGGKLETVFFADDAVAVARNLLGKVLVRVYDDGVVTRYRITATEAYMGEEDKACHASKGRTGRTEVMYWRGGYVYVYLIYGMYWMFNIVTGSVEYPQAVLICGLDSVIGSGRVGRLLNVDKSFYGEDLLTSDRIWIEDSDEQPDVVESPRVGVDYAGDEWKNKNWRFRVQP